MLKDYRLRCKQPPPVENVFKRFHGQGDGDGMMDHPGVEAAVLRSTGRKDWGSGI